MTDGGIFKRYRQSLSTKLFVLVVACVLIAEAVVLIPSIAYHRLMYLQERIEAAFLVSVAYESPYGEIIDPSIADELFATAGVKGVSALRGDRQTLILAPEIDIDPAEGAPPPVMHYVDLRTGFSFDRLTSPWATLFSTGDDLINATGKARFARDGSVSVIIGQADLRKDLWAYARNVALLSLLISSLTATFVYFRLARMIVDPVKALSRNMMAFELDPENPDAVLRPCAREDEIGVAEKSLAALESRTQTLLSERRRLAALGAGISKISHDLRNVLASAQLMSDRLAKSDDPRVTKLAPRLIASLDRAVALSRDTLSLARMSPATLKKRRLSLHELVDEVMEDAARLTVEMKNETPDEIEIIADSTNLYRAIFNLVKNAAEAIDEAAPQPEAVEAPSIVGKVVVSATIAGEEVVISVADTGPGLPEHARQFLFEPFKGSQKPGGSGLGVAIAAEIAKAHGGRLALERSGPGGTLFAMTLPVGSLPGADENQSRVGETSSRASSPPAP
ncbi:MAG: sensor histidine kinase [Alphaproteobacteria bacterium]|nr:sensor histidine kinase [Alphaproteobacteria bacterium]